jgi:hypothetical protein
MALARPVKPTVIPVTRQQSVLQTLAPILSAATHNASTSVKPVRGKKQAEPQEHVLSITMEKIPTMPVAPATLVKMAAAAARVVQIPLAWEKTAPVPTPVVPKKHIVKMVFAWPTTLRALPFALAAAILLRFVSKMVKTIFAHRAAPTRQMIAPI